MSDPSSLTIESLLQRNKDYASSAHKAVPNLKTIFRGDFKLGSPSILIISCLDSRANPYNYIQLKPFEAIVIRNVGGRIKSALTDILALDTQFGLKRIILVQHNDCGTSYVEKGDVRKHVEETTADSANAGAWEEEVMTHVHTPSEHSIREDLALLKQQHHIRKELAETAIGLWLDVQTGLLKEIPQPRL